MTPRPRFSSRTGSHGVSGEIVFLLRIAGTERQTLGRPRMAAVHWYICESDALTLPGNVISPKNGFGSASLLVVV
jgi:hypothetical protein